MQQVSVALALGRPCLVFAFSGSSDLAELRLTPPPHRRRRRPAGRARRARSGAKGGSGGGGGARWAGSTDRRCLRRLLDFLACSFGGGTDVAGPLRRALDVLEDPQDEEDAAYSGADLLLVSDGELPDPPLDEATHARLRRLQATTGLRVCGLLIGEPRPTPLDAMCDEVSGCLARFDPLALMREATAARNGGAPDADADADADARAARRAAVARVRSRSALPVMSAISEGVAGGAAFGEEWAAAALKTRAEEDVAAQLGAADVAAATAAEAALAAFSEAGEAGEAGGAGGGPLGGGGVIAALRAATLALERDLVERDAEARLLLLALVGGEHLLLLGPPGTAKSELCRRLSRLSGLSYFERTLTRFSTPEELFGPLSLAALERDEYRRATAGYAPEAELLFIDEVFKSNSAILNTLLTLLNERLFDDGATRGAVPLLSAVAASNEGPESEELDALYDRFLLRKVVRPVSDDGVLELLLGATAVPPPTAPLDAPPAPSTPTAPPVPPLCAALGAVRAAAGAVELPRHAALLLRDARAFVRAQGADGLGGGYVSDRRLRCAPTCCMCTCMCTACTPRAHCMCMWHVHVYACT